MVAGRKFWMAILTLFICTALELKLPGGISNNFMFLACGLNGVYSAANVAKHKKDNT